MSKEFHSSCSNKKKSVNLNSTILKWNDINQSNKNPNKYYSIFSSLFYADRKMNATFQSNTKFFFWRRNLLCLFSFKYSNRILFQLFILTKSHLFIFFFSLQNEKLSFYYASIFKAIQKTDPVQRFQPSTKKIFEN